MAYRSKADNLELTVVMDNYVDVILKDEDPVKRWGVKSALSSPRQLIAEHGLSLLVEVSKGELKRKVLMDFGYTEEGVLRNLELLGVNLKSIDMLFLSHGHRDHYAALINVLKSIGRPIPVYVHPDAFNERLFTFPDGDTIGPWQLKPKDIEEAGGVVVASKNPIPLAPGLFTSGEVKRVTDFEKPMEVSKRVKDGLYEDDPILDDQALIVNLEGKGLVVIAGCAHAGIINTIRHAMEITGENKLYAVVGGFHLSGAEASILDKTLEELRKLSPELIMPMHCTGFQATLKIALAMPKVFKLSSVGTKLVLKGG